MKEFFKKIWQALKAAFVNLCSAIKGWLKELPQERYVYFIIGLVLTAFLAIVFPGAVEWPMVPVIALFVVLGMIRTFIDKPVFWKNYFAACIGAVVIQFLCWIA